VGGALISNSVVQLDVPQPRYLDMRVARLHRRHGTRPGHIGLAGKRPADFGRSTPTTGRSSGPLASVGARIARPITTVLADPKLGQLRAISLCARRLLPIDVAAGRLLGLGESQIAHAIAMAASSDASFAVIRAKPLSQWKGLASAQSALGAMNTLFLARRGVQGPLRVIEGPNGIDNLLHTRLRVDWDKQGYEGVVESTIKKYNAQIHTQSAIQCMIDLVRQNKEALSVAGGLDPRKVVSIEAEVPQITYDFTGGGHYGVEKEVRTKEQADHSLAYMLAVALLDGNVMPAQFAPDRIIRADVQSLMKKVSAKPNQEYTDEYPRRMPAKITVRLQDGTTFQHEVQDYPGLASHPFTWEDEVEKFDQLGAGRIGDALSKEIKDAVRSLESIQVSDLMALLGRVKTLT
jgi:2-methylcitrate dehydratase